MNARAPKKKKKGQETRASTRKPSHKGHCTMIELWYSSETKLMVCLMTSYLDGNFLLKV